MPDEKKLTEARLETTSGSYPEGDKFKVVKPTEAISVFVAEGVKELKITNTNGWVLVAGGRKIDPSKIWEQEGFLGAKVVLDYGPDHSGGGNA